MKDSHKQTPGHESAPDSPSDAASRATDPGGPPRTRTTGQLAIIGAGAGGATTLNGPLIGQIIGQRFELLGLAGSGGMSTVYRALDRHSGSVVAVKLASARGLNPNDMERFVREANMLALLQHPGIVSYVAHGHTPAGFLYLAMEWLEGEDLAHRLARAPLSVRESLVLIRRVADALSLAHRRGIVHRDLKPSNLFLRHRSVERVTLLDFGIARMQGAGGGNAVGSNMTQTGHVIGTPEYMAPEQARGDRVIGPAVDVFALGCVLYECLAGQPPFVAEHVAAQLARVLFEEAAPLSDVRPGLPQELTELVSGMLQKDASRRPHDASALLAAVERILASGAFGEESEGLQPAAAARRRLSTLELELMSVVLAAPRTSAQSPPPTASGATALAGSDELQSAYREELADELRRLGMRVTWRPDGSLLSVIGGAASAADQALQAARSALELQERWPEARLVLVTGCDESHTPLPHGEAVQRAEQLLARSSGLDDGILLDEVSAGLLDNLFVLGQSLSGERLLLAPSSAQAQEEDPGRIDLAPCLGRDAELSMIEAMLVGCREEYKVEAMLIKGPQGIGKTRLRREIMRRLENRGEDVAVWVGQLTALSAGAPYGLLSSALFALCQIYSGESIDEQRGKLERRLGRELPEADRRRVVEFIGELCGVPFEDTSSPRLRAARSDPRVMSRELCTAFLDLLRAECRRQPILLILDNLQWADGVSVDLVGAALRELADLPLSILALGRPEVTTIFPRLWAERVQEIALGGLSRKASERLVGELLRGAQHGPPSSLPAGILPRILSQAGGNPLFLEELVRTFLRTPRNGATELPPPTTILAMLQARLSGLERGARRVVRAASLFGETFPRRGLLPLLGQDSLEELDTWLRILREAEIIERSANTSSDGDSEYFFRHALLREAAHSLLTPDDRRIGQELVAAYLATRTST